MDINKIRNFSIIAHIDHGKSTLADRLLEKTHSITPREFRDQILDSMDLERERGITIKAHPVTMKYKSLDGISYMLNLIDTPGHVDFSYEVARSIAACEGVLLLVDASQGVEAQTVANLHLALSQGLKVIPVINKIDLPNAMIGECKRQLNELFHFENEDILTCSAKNGDGVDEILERIINIIPPPKGSKEKPLQALIFDSVYDIYRGIRIYVRVFNGEVSAPNDIVLMSNKKEYELNEVGIFTPKVISKEQLRTGEVGYFVVNVKDARDVNTGDTITIKSKPAEKALPGYKQIKPMVFNSIYPINMAEYDNLREALHKLRLNDASFVFEPDNSAALGYGFRCGFLGLLHSEIIQERLEREFEIGIVATSPSVVYNILLNDRSIIEVDNPTKFPDVSEIEMIEEPFIKAHIITPTEYIGPLMQLAQEKRGSCTKTETLDKKRVILTFELPLNEIIIDFYDQLKSITRGYGSMDYDHMGYNPSDIVKLDILLNGDPVDAFSALVHRGKADFYGRNLCKKLKELIPRHMFHIAVQASIGGKVIARETIKAYRKDVISKCYGGDVTRKRKLLEKQKMGKKKMKQIGKIGIPQNVFMDVLK